MRGQRRCSWGNWGTGREFPKMLSLYIFLRPHCQRPMGALHGWMRGAGFIQCSPHVIGTPRPRIWVIGKASGLLLCSRAGTNLILLEGKFQARPTRLITPLDSCWSQRFSSTPSWGKDVSIFLCKIAGSGNRKKNEAEDHRMSLPVNTCAVCWEGNGFLLVFPRRSCQRWVPLS